MHRSEYRQCGNGKSINKLLAKQFPDPCDIKEKSRYGYPGYRQPYGSNVETNGIIDGGAKDAKQDQDKTGEVKYPVFKTELVFVAGNFLIECGKPCHLSKNKDLAGTYPFYGTGRPSSQLLNAFTRSRLMSTSVSAAGSSCNMSRLL